MDATDVLLAAVLAVMGVVVVGPVLSRAVLAWVGRHVVVPALMGREPARDEVTSVPRRCARCGATLESRWAGVPRLAWAAALGRCRRCGAPRPRWTASVEVATGLAFGLLGLRFGWSPELPAVLAGAAGLVAISAVDLVYLRIPTPFVRATALALAVTVLGAAVAVGPVDALVGVAWGAAAYGGFLGLAWALSPRLIGFGDVRLAVVIGAVVGWVAWEPDHPLAGPLSGVLAAAFAAGLVGTVVGTVLLVIHRRSRPFAFGPAMALGALATLLATGPTP